MDTLDNETLEQIKNIVNIAKNDKTPLQKQKVKKAKKVKEVTLTSPLSDALNSEPEKIVPSPEPVQELAPEPVTVAEPKKKRVQSEKQKAAELAFFNMGITPEHIPLIETTGKGQLMYVRAIRSY